MQMAHQPDDRCRERCHKEQKNDPALPSLLAQRTRPPAASALIEVVPVFQRDRDVELLIACIVFFAPAIDWRRGGVLCARWRVENHALEFFDLLSQFRFGSRYLFLPAAKRRSRSRRASKHRVTG